MNIIDKLRYFESIKVGGYIDYDEDGSGTYYRYHYGGGLNYKISFDGIGKIGEFRFYGYDGKTHTNTIRENIVDMLDILISYIYIDGWVRDKLDERYR